MPFLENFSEDLKAYRKINGLTQTDLARSLDFSTETISAWERGIRKPNIQQIPRLARLLGVDVKELIQSINVDLHKGNGSKSVAREVEGRQQDTLVTVFPSQRACEEHIREAARTAKKVKIMTVRGEKYFMGSRSLLHNLCNPKRNPGAHVKVLVLSPASPHITEQLAVRLDHESSEEMRDKMQHSLNNLKFYAQRNKDFEVRCYWESPNFKILRFDNIMFVSSFVGGGPKNDHSARMFQMVRDSNPLFAGFDRYFDDIWERARPPE
jgi:transcriptional regulator with XRE-family HTH domain